MPLDPAWQRDVSELAWRLVMEPVAAAERTRLDEEMARRLAATDGADAAAIVEALRVVLGSSKPAQTSSPMAPFVLACSRNGYVREQAVRHAPAPPSAACLGIMLVRLDDWVPEVRIAAEDAIERYLPVLDDGIVAGAALAVLDVRTWHRLAPRGSALIEAVLARPAVEAQLAAVLARDTSARGERLFKAMLARPRFDRLLQSAFEASRNGNIAALAFRALLACERGRLFLREGPLSIDRATTIDRDRYALLLAGMSSRWPKVRAMALREFSPNAASGDAEHRQRLEAFVLDTSWSVVSPACFWLRAAGGDPRALLRARLDSGAPMRLAQLQALAEVGDAADAEPLRRYFAHQRGARGVAALAAAQALDPQGTEPLLLEALWDGTPGEARAAARALERADVLVPFEPLYAAAAEGESFIERGYWQVMRPHGPVRGLAVLMRLAGQASANAALLDRIAIYAEQLPDYLAYSAVREPALLADMAARRGAHPRLDAKYQRWFTS